MRFVRRGSSRTCETQVFFEVGRRQAGTAPKKSLEEQVVWHDDCLAWSIFRRRINHAEIDHASMDVGIRKFIAKMERLQRHHYKGAEKIAQHAPERHGPDGDEAEHIACHGDRRERAAGGESAGAAPASWPYFS